MKIVGVIIHGSNIRKDHYMNHYESDDNSPTLITSIKKSSEEITICYYLYRSQIYPDSREAFGIEITSLFDGKCDRSYFDEITSARERALELFNILSDNFVTPCTLSEILEDML